MSFKCNFCKANLSNEYTLSKHQKTTKKCLNLQGVMPEGNFKCDICKKTFIRKSVLKTHSISCTKKKELKDNTLETKYNTLETKYNMLLEFESKYNLLETKYNMLLEFESKYNLLETKYNMLLEEKNYWKETKELYKENKSKETKIQFLTKK
jgi:hypothetical protein